MGRRCWVTCNDAHEREPPFRPSEALLFRWKITMTTGLSPRYYGNRLPSSDRDPEGPPWRIHTVSRDAIVHGDVDRSCHVTDAPIGPEQGHVHVVARRDRHDAPEVQHFYFDSVDALEQWFTYG